MAGQLILRACSAWCTKICRKSRGIPYMHCCSVFLVEVPCYFNNNYKTKSTYNWLREETVCTVLRQSLGLLQLQVKNKRLYLKTVSSYRDAQMLSEETARLQAK